MAEGTIQRMEEDLDVAAQGELGKALQPAPGLLPGEVRPHPSPFKYVVIAVVLVIVTSIEVAVSYLDGEIPDGLIVALLLVMAIIKFAMVASWYMHLQTDRPIFRRFFVLGVIAAVALYAVVLATLHVLS
jgi:caa(3)-type oxidase subunit IV